MTTTEKKTNKGWANIKPFKKGEKRTVENGRKGGKARSGSMSLTKILREMLDREIEVEMDDIFDKEAKKQTIKNWLNLILLAKAIKGDIKAIHEIYNRVEGKAIQTTQLSGLDGNPIETTTTLIDLKMTAEEATRIYMDKLK